MRLKGKSPFSSYIEDETMNERIREFYDMKFNIHDVHSIKIPTFKQVEEVTSEYIKN